MASPGSELFEDTDDTHTALMRATYDALCKHGYAGLTIQRIGDEFPKSKSLLYQHYDGKDELLEAFLGFMVEHFETKAERPIDAETSALEQLQTFLDHLLDPAHDEFMCAMLELRAQVAHNENYRNQFMKTDQIFHEHLTAVIRSGIEQDAFRDVDADQMAELLLTTFHGALLRQVTTENSEWMQAVGNELDEFIHSRLLLDSS